MDAACTQASVAPCFAHCAGDSVDSLSVYFVSIVSMVRHWIITSNFETLSRHRRAQVSCRTRPSTWRILFATGLTDNHDFSM